MMSISFSSVLIMFFIDGYMHMLFTEYSITELIITLLGRLIQYLAVPLLIYYIFYWPYRRSLVSWGSFDVSMINDESRMSNYSELSIINRITFKGGSP